MWFKRMIHWNFYWFYSHTALTVFRVLLCFKYTFVLTQTVNMSKVNYLSIIICVFAHWSSILNIFHFNFAFALSHIGNEPPQAYMVAVARCYEFKSSNQGGLISFKSKHFLPSFFLTISTCQPFAHDLSTLLKTHWWAENSSKHVSLVISIEIFC